MCVLSCAENELALVLGQAKTVAVNTIILDKSTPGVSELVSGWEDGMEYRLTVRVVQSSSNDKQFVGEIVGDIEDNGPISEAEEPDVAPPATAPAGSKKKPVPPTSPLSPKESDDEEEEV